VVKRHQTCNREVAGLSPGRSASRTLEVFLCIHARAPSCSRYPD